MRECSSEFSSPRHFQMIVLAQALEVWAHHKIKVNTAYTPTAMIRTAEILTGQKFRSRDYLVAANALREAAKGRK